MLLNTFNLFLIVIPVTVVMGSEDSSETLSRNLTSILWAHAVNNQSLLKQALNDENVHMIEADVSFGTLINSSNSVKIPIMAHPPNTVSDLSLQQFLTNVTEFNKKNITNVTKGVKLDFKSIDAFNKSIDILQNYDQVEIWLNADILPGPINSTATPVNAEQFLTGCKKFPKSIISSGWTTNFNVSNASYHYTDDQIGQMITVLNKLKITQPVTFPVRAGLVAYSHQQMTNLLSNITNSTLTIWSGEEDVVEVDLLRELIFKVGLDRVYVDVPEKLRNELHLESSSNQAAPHLGVLSVVLSTLVMLLTSKLL